jgi:hypothetical protein
MTMVHGPLLDFFQFSHHLTTNLGPVLRFCTFSLRRASVSGVQSSNFVTANLSSRPSAFAAVSSASASSLHRWALAGTSSLGSCTAADTGPIWSKSCFDPNFNVAFC